MEGNKKYIIGAGVLLVLAIASYLVFFKKAKEYELQQEEAEEYANAVGAAQGISLMIGAGIFFLILIVGVIIMGILYGGAQAGKAVKNASAEDLERGLDVADKAAGVAGKIRRA